MTLIRLLLSTALALSVGACATSPPIHYFSLDDGRPTAVGSPNGPSVAVTRVELPDLIDRPQLVMRTVGHQVQFNDQYEWAEPLRRQIPRVIARDLGETLDSGCAMALPIDAQDFDVDFKVMLDIQRLDVIPGQGVNLDVIWRVRSRNGGMFVGRSQVREPLEATAGPSGYPAAVAAQSRALRAVAADIGTLINRCRGELTEDGAQIDEGSRSASLCGGLTNRRAREPGK